MNRYAFLLIAALALNACSGLNARPTTPAAAQPAQTQVEAGGPTGTTAASPTPAAENTAPEQPAPGETAPAESAALPDCTSPATPAVAMTEGPYYTPDTPERSVLYEDGMPGIKLILSGYVLDTNCRPVANAWLDFWQADANGVYDNTGYTLRGHQFADENGRYQLETVVPGQYPGRTEHIHVKVQAPGGSVVTTQLYFPGSTSNEGDRIYAEAMQVKVLKESAAEMEAEFNFVIATR